MFAVCSNNLHAAVNGSESGEVSIAAQQDLKVGDAAPDFTFTQDGKSMKLSDFAYYVVVVSFLDSSAESSKINADVAKLKVQYENSDIAFINISVDENAEIAELYGVSAEPAVCIVTTDGIIYSMDKGNVDISQKLFGR